MYVTRFCAPETRRESRIVPGFDHFGALQQAVNHIFHKSGRTSEPWNTPKTRRESCALQGFEHFETETRHESCIVQGFKQFRTVQYTANHIFCKVSSTSEHWNEPRIPYFTRFSQFGALKHAANPIFISRPIMAPVFWSYGMKRTTFWPSWGGG